MTTLGFKRPSNTALVIVSSISTFLGARYYDSYLAKKTRARLTAVAQQLADLPLKKNEVLPFYRVYMVRPDGDSVDKVGRYFDNYIKVN
jgi:hypothetical protein